MGQKQNTWDIARRWLSTALIAVGLALALSTAAGLAHARIYDELVARGIIHLESEPALETGNQPGVAGTDPSGIDPGTADPGNPRPAGTDNPPPVWRIYIPKIRVARVLIHGITAKALEQGPGVYPQGAIPGEPGNLSIAGHRNAYGSPFWYLDRLVAGDEIYVTVGDTAFLYRMERSFVVEPTDWTVIAPTEYDAITLTTCHPLGSTTHRLIVRGRLVGVQDSLPRSISR